MKKFLSAVAVFFILHLACPLWANVMVKEYILQGSERAAPEQAEQSAAVLQKIEQDYQVRISFFIHSWDGKSALEEIIGPDKELYNEYNQRGRRAMFILIFSPGECSLVFNMRPLNLLDHDQMTEMSNLIRSYPLSNTLEGVSANFVQKLDSFIRKELFLSPWDKFVEENNQVISSAFMNIGFVVFLILLLISAGLFIFLTLRNFKRFPFLILIAIPVVVLQIYKVIPDFLAVIAYFLIFGFELFNSRVINK